MNEAEEVAEWKICKLIKERGEDKASLDKYGHYLKRSLISACANDQIGVIFAAELYSFIDDVLRGTESSA